MENEHLKHYGDEVMGDVDVEKHIFHDDIEAFLAHSCSALASCGIDLSELYLDGISYDCVSNEEYLQICMKMKHLGERVLHSFSNKKNPSPYSVFRLRIPHTYDKWVLSAIAVICPASIDGIAEPTISGWSKLMCTYACGVDITVVPSVKTLCTETLNKLEEFSSKNSCRCDLAMSMATFDKNVMDNGDHHHSLSSSLIVKIDETTSFALSPTRPNPTSAPRTPKKSGDCPWLLEVYIYPLLTQCAMVSAHGGYRHVPATYFAPPVLKTHLYR